MTEHEYRLICERFSSEGEREDAIARLDAHEPLAYILGEWYFYRQTYKLNKACLIPRADTEHVVTKLCELLPQNGRFADLCTGSGCIAISSLCERQDASAAAVDISSEALEAARENAEINGVSDRIEIKQSNVLAGNCLFGEKFDIIVSNPPYIRTDVIKTLSEEVRREPTAALDGGADGLDFYRHITEKYKDSLKDGGCFIFEIGYDQAEDLKSLCCGDCFYGLEIIKDYGGNDRVAVVRVKHGA